MKDTRQKLRDEMDTLALAMAAEANKLKGKDNTAVKLDVLKHVTQYLSMANRQPEESVGADIVNFQRRIAGTNSERGIGGDAAERGPDEPESDEADDTDSDSDTPSEDRAA